MRTKACANTEIASFHDPPALSAFHKHRAPRHPKYPPVPSAHIWNTFRKSDSLASINAFKAAISPLIERSPTTAVVSAIGG